MAGAWKSLVNQAPQPIATTLLLTDGTVLAQRVSSNNWYRLKPDANGDYRKGTWSTLANSVSGPLYYASGILRDGRVIVAGGEYNFGKKDYLKTVEIYDPVANSWKMAPSPAGWSKIGDAPGCVLPDGRFFLGEVTSTRTALYDPSTNKWTAARNKLAKVGEESWSLLPDGTVHAVDCSNPPYAEKYIIAQNRWVPAGQTPQVLVDSISEIGASVLLPDGRLFVIGATGRTALYTMPAVASQPGAWVQGPVIPSVKVGEALGAVDAPAAVLPNGRVLFTAGPITIPATFQTPSHWFEFDPQTNTIKAVARPIASNTEPYWARLLMLPTGQVLFTNGIAQAEIYTPDGAPDEAWRPTITTCPSTLSRGSKYTLHGRQLNGLTQCVYYGNDATQATNYPIVRLEAAVGSAVYYCRTSGFSTMGLQTGTVVHHCDFVVPASVPLGAYRLVVVANGIASASFGVAVALKPAAPTMLAVVDAPEVAALERELEALHGRFPEAIDVKLLREDPAAFHREQDAWLVAVREWTAQMEELQMRMTRTLTRFEARAVAGVERAEPKVTPRKITAAAAVKGAQKRAYNDGTPEEEVTKEAARFSAIVHGLSRSGGKPLSAKPTKVRRANSKRTRSVKPRRT